MMRSFTLRNAKSAAGALALLLSALHVSAQPNPAGEAWVYHLINGSVLSDDCPICDRVTVPRPMRGSFELHVLAQGPLFTTYSVSNIAFTAGSTSGPAYSVTGEGTFRVGGELATQQALFLTLSINDGVTNQTCYLANALPDVTRPWPMLQVSVDQTNGTLIRQYHLELDAAPFREIWFSTAKGFQAGIWNSPSNSLSEGDLLASSGRVIKRNAELTARLGIASPVPDLGLKDIDILPGGELVFSMNQTVQSGTLGTVTSDDLLSDRGRLVRSTTRDLITVFGPGPPLPEYVGLGAVQVLDNGQIYFSVQSPFGSKTLARTIQPGDLLADDGTVVRSGAQLLAAFKPVAATNDYGLRAVHFWPGGETWFSTRDGFYDSNSNYYAGGDLLSDQGYVVYRNAELVAGFQPIGVAGDLGLDGLFVVSDVTQPKAGAVLSAPYITNSPLASLVIQASPGRRVVQFLKATDPTGPYSPVGPITPVTTLIDAAVLTNQAAAFYWLRQW